MHPPAWEILCCWTKLEAGEGTAPWDPLAQQNKGVRCDPSELLVFSDIGAMKILLQMSAMGGDVRMDRQRDTSCWEDLGRLCKRQEGMKAGPEPYTQLIKQAALEVIARDMLGLLLCGWCCHKRDEEGTKR